MIVRVVYAIDSKIIATVVDASDGTTVHPPTMDTIEDTEENILASAEAVGITDLQPIIDFLNPPVV